MLRIIPKSGLLTPISEHLQNFQTVRWLRKPRKPLWMPTAKSKLFKIPPRPELPVEEDEELTRLFNNYRTTMKSIRRYLTQRYSVMLQAKADTELLKKTLEEDFVRCSSINDKWNEEVKKQREERVAKEFEAELEFVRNRKAQLLREKEEEFAFAEEMVRREKEAVANFVTLENLDEVIEKAINNPVDYNFAVDLKGNKIYGRETKPQDSVKLKQ